MQIGVNPSDWGRPRGHPIIRATSKNRQRSNGDLTPFTYYLVLTFNTLDK